MNLKRLTFLLLSVVIINKSAANEGERWGKDRKPAQSLGSFGEGAPVYGVYRVKSSVYAIRDSTPYIETFSAFGGNSQLKNVTVNGMQGPYDMVGIGHQDLFILDWFDWANVTVFGLKSSGGASYFSLQESVYTSVALSASNQEVIATCSQPQKIKEFSPTGQLLKEIYVNVTQPRHTVKLRGGAGYVMCHGYGTDQLHRVCHLDNTGVILNCYGSTNGSGVGHLDVPSRVLEDDEGHILVADLNNKRVVQLSPKLTYIRDLVTSADGLQGPYRLLLDGPLLYVADNTVTGGLATAGRILTFKIEQYWH